MKQTMGSCGVRDRRPGRGAKDYGRWLACLALLGSARPGAGLPLDDEAAPAPVPSAAAPALAPPADLPPEPPAAARESLREWLAAAALPLQGGALSVSVSHRGETLHEQVGYRDVARRLPATPQTSFRIASVSKLMTAIVVLRLEEKGLLGLADEVQRHLPAFPRKGEPLRISHLLGHLGGVPHYRNCRKECALRTPHSSQASLAIFQDWPLVARPGARFVYSSYGYNLLAAVAEKAAGQPFEALLDSAVFRPAQMSRSQLERGRLRIEEPSRGYRLTGDGLVDSERVDISSRFGGGGVRSTPDDMLRFGEAVLDHRLLPPATTVRMQTPMATAEGLSTDYGMGAAVYPQNGRWLVAHAGSQPETTTLLALYPSEQLVVFIATNVEDQASLLREVHERVVALWLDEGEARVHPTGADEVSAIQAGALFGTMSHGVAHVARHSVAAPHSAGTLLHAFEALHALTDEERIRADVAAARRRESISDDPAGAQVYLHAGSHMAALIARAFGAEHLRRYARAGPFAFALDYASACEQLDCPQGLRLAPALVAQVRAWEPAWRAAAERARELLQPRYAPAGPTSGGQPALVPPPPALVAATLEEVLADARMRPDLSRRLLHWRTEAARAGRADDARSYLALALAWFPTSPPLWLAHAGAQLQAGDLAGAEASVARWAALDTSAPDDKAKTLQAQLRGWRAQSAAPLRKDWRGVAGALGRHLRATGAHTAPAPPPRPAGQSEARPEPVEGLPPP